MKFTLNTKHLLISIIIVCWIILLIVLGSTLSILINQTLFLTPTSEGFSNFLTIFRFPISLLIALLALITLHVTIQRLLQTDEQLKLINKQISATRQPEIFIDEIETEVFTDIEGEYKNQLTITKDGLRNKLPYFTIYNIGAGSSVENKFKFDFDFENAVKLIQSLNNKVNWFDIYKISTESQCIQLKNSQYEVIIRNTDFDSSKYLNFIIPVSRDTQVNRITFPSLYLELYIIFVSLSFREAAEYKFLGFVKEEEVVKIFPKLFLNVIYKDIGGITSTRKFQITLETDNFSNPFYEGRLRNTENNYKIKVSPTN